MPDIARGFTITLNAVSVDADDIATDAADLTVDIIDPDGANVITNAAPTRVSVGIYQYQYPVAADAELGTWHIEWSGTIGGQPVVVDEDFIVMAASALVAGTIVTVDDLITQVEDHLLSGDRDELNMLASPVAADDSQITFTQSAGGIVPGSYMAVDLEVMYIWSVDNTSKVVTVQRGMLGSAAADHLQNALVYVNPLFSKWQMFKALNVEIVSLSGADNGLFAVKDFTLQTQNIGMTYDVPAGNADLRSILEIRWDSTGAERAWARVDRRQHQIIRNVTADTATATGLMLRVEEQLTPGRRMVVRYAGDFGTLPSTLGADASAATAMTDTMLDIPAMGAAARLMGVREAKRSFTERGSDSRRSSEVQSGSASRSAAVLLQLLNGRIKSEADRLRQLWTFA